MKKFTIAACSMLASIITDAQILPGDMETWRTFTDGNIMLEAPQDWWGLDSLHNRVLNRSSEKETFKTTDAHSGNFAVKIVTTKRTGGADRLDEAVLSNYHPLFWDTVGIIAYVDGTTITQKPTSITAWVKFTGANLGDAGRIEVITFKSPGPSGGSIILTSMGEKQIGTSSSYRQITVPIIYTDPTMPDQIAVTFHSSKALAPVEGNTLYIDDVMLNFPSGVSIPLLSERIVKMYPNPSLGIINLETTDISPLTWEAMAADGRVIATHTFTGKASVQLTANPGFYFYRVTSASGKLMQSGNFSLE